MQALTDDLLDGALAIAQYTKLPVRRVYALADSGELPVIKKGRRLYARKSELEAAFKAAA